MACLRWNLRDHHMSATMITSILLAYNQLNWYIYDQLDAKSLYIQELALNLLVIKRIQFTNVHPPLDPQREQYQQCRWTVCGCFFIICTMIWYSTALKCIITDPKAILSPESSQASNKYHQVKHLKVYLMKTPFFLFFFKTFLCFWCKIYSNISQLLMVYTCFIGAIHIKIL